MVFDQNFLPSVYHVDFLDHFLCHLLVPLLFLRVDAHSPNHGHQIVIIATRPIVQGLERAHLRLETGLGCAGIFQVLLEGLCRILRVVIGLDSSLGRLVIGQHLVLHCVVLTLEACYFTLVKLDLLSQVRVHVSVIHLDAKVGLPDIPIDHFEASQRTIILHCLELVGEEKLYFLREFRVEHMISHRELDTIVLR